jgi:hypothetical protein
MYKIIGADQKQYGPISADQIRQWISEGRVNGQTVACAEGTDAWKPLSAFPEFGFTANPPTPGIANAHNSTPLTEEELLSRDYSLDIGEAVSRSWELVKANFWPVIGISFVNSLAMNGVNQLVGLISRPGLNQMIQTQQFSPAATALLIGTTIITMPLTTVFMAGLFRYYLKLIRGQDATIGDAFSGFTDGFAQLALLGFVQGILVLIGIVLCVIPGIYLATAWYFSIFLVADRRMNFWSAMELSRKVVSKHWFMVFGFMLVMGLLAACGIIACCVGILVSVPVAFMALAIAYETIFRRQNA